MHTLCPRTEVFSLVLPGLMLAGRNLTSSAFFCALQDLSRMQTTEHLISYDRWLIVAKEQLKWNDYCILLFWTNLQAALRSSKQKRCKSWNNDFDLVDIEFIAIFLILHLPENASRSASPTKIYESIWPHELESDSLEFQSSVSQVTASTPISPVRAQSPISPRKFFAFPGGGVTSPKQVRGGTFDFTDHNFQDIHYKYN